MCVYTYMYVCVCVCVCVCVYCLYMLNAYIYIHILHFYLISYEVVSVKKKFNKSLINKQMLQCFIFTKVCVCTCLFMLCVCMHS